MAGKDEITHRGRVVSIGKDTVSVEIVSQSACASCHAAGLCGSLDQTRKIIEVRTYGIPPRCAVGDEVIVCLAKKMGLKAVLLSYVIPLLILLILVVSLQTIVASELLLGLCAVGGVALYYLALYLRREKLAEEYEFYIKEIIN